MLYISFNEKEDTLRLVDDYFNFQRDDSWLNDDLVKKMIKDIDKSDVISENLIISPVLGPIPPERLSTGVKALIIMYKVPDIEIWATVCGDNCAKWILEISKIHDVHIVLEHIMHFPDNFRAICSDNNRKLCNLYDYRDCILKAFSK